MRVLVTGGTGFLGKSIVSRLLKRGDDVIIYSRGVTPSSFKNNKVKYVYGDISDKNKLLQASQGCSAIIHTAAKVGIWGSYYEYFQTNVQGTEAVLNACQQQGIKFLIFTSSPSVVFNCFDICGADESFPYSKHYVTHYAKTKALAEQMILSSAKPDLNTIILRPGLLWGPGDNKLIPRLLERVPSGRFRLIKGSKHIIDTLYIDNAAVAHLLALDHLMNQKIYSRKIYFISQDQPIEINEFFTRMISALHLPAVDKYISEVAAYRIGTVLEILHKLFFIKSEPMMTRFLAKQLSLSHWFDITAAKRDLDYRPIVSIAEGFDILSQQFKRG